MYKNSVLLAIGAALLCSLFFVDGGYAFQIVNRPPPVDFLTVAKMNGWTEGPMQVVGILSGAGLVVLVGLGIRRLRHNHHYHYGQQT
jgi:hypothetical protein